MPDHWNNLMKELHQEGFHDRVFSFYNRCILELGREVKILDLGAGRGDVSKSLAEKEYAKSIIAYDIDLESMKDLAPHPKITKEAAGNVTNLPFESGSFDVVVCRYAFHHFENKLGVLNEISRALNSSGLLLYSDPVLSEHSKFVLNPLYFIREHHFHGFLGYFETIELLGQAGFDIALSRPYKYRYSSFDKYLEGVDDGFESRPPADFSDILKSKLRYAWNNLAPLTKKESEIDPQDLSKGFVYHLIDIGAIKM